MEFLSYALCRNNSVFSAITFGILSVWLATHGSSSSNSAATKILTQAVSESEELILGSPLKRREKRSKDSLKSLKGAQKASCRRRCVRPCPVSQRCELPCVCRRGRDLCACVVLDFKQCKTETHRDSVDVVYVCG